MSKISTRATEKKFTDRILDAHELALVYLGISADTVFKDLSRAPHRLPPSIKIQGRRGRRWLESDVLDWLKSLRQVSETPISTPPPTPLPLPHKRGPGRPSKAQQSAYSLEGGRQ
jgi:predicted DNA-binding transcriptional regulator AlpA